MNLISEEVESLISQIKKSMISLALTDIVICPPFLFIPKTKEMLADTVIKIGAQDCFWEEKGAFTGEISGKQLSDFCAYVIIGHSERRKYQKETDDEIRKKVKAAAKTGLIVILCIGESLKDYRQGNSEVVIDQLRKDLKGLTPQEADKILVAYEPIWAIGTKNPATPDYANKIATRIRQEAGSILGKDRAQKLRILYGGSVNRVNAAEFVTASEIDGLLVGNASIDAEEFISIVKNVNKIK